MNSKSVFVFYTLKTNSNWTYPEFPKSWKWIGSGSTRPLGDKSKVRFEREEQFNGLEESYNEMIQLLNSKFIYLKNNNKIVDFLITDSYL